MLIVYWGHNEVYS